jgi:ATP-dependent DNA helicase HFM1/MER3
MQIFKKEYPAFANFFNFEQFNEVQTKCYKPVMKDQHNIIVSAPTSSGKTVIF